MRSPSEMEWEMNNCSEAQGQPHCFEFDDYDDGLVFFGCRYCDLVVVQFEDTRGGG